MFDVFKNKFSHDIFLQKYSMDGKETWADTCKRVVQNVCQDLLSEDIKNEIYHVMLARKFIPGGRYLYSAGRSFHQYNNCFLLRAEDSREGWAELMHNASAALMTGGGIGVNYNKIRPEGSIIKRTGGQATGPLALMHMVNEAGRFIMQGGQRRSAIYASLLWKHQDVFKFMKVKDWSQDMRTLKEKDFNFPLPMELTNISVDYDTEFFLAAEDPNHPLHSLAWEVFLFNCRQAFSTAEPGHMFNFCKDDENLRNACCEVTSEDDSDKCNLGTVWMQAHKTRQDFINTTRLGTLFLLCGGITSDLPYEKVRDVGIKNNRIGLGLGGMAEWLMQRGQQYQVTPELHKWLASWEQMSNETAYIGAKRLGVSEPKGKRAIAPTGTIGLLAESTTGIEPLFCKAYLRRYLKGSQWMQQYVIDGAVKNLIEQGIKQEHIFDSYDLTFEQRVKFQADVQNYVDMAISSTCNMPSWGSLENNETNVEDKAKILFKYAKRLRGFTVYPDGARAGQPLTRVDLVEALGKEGQVFESNEQECLNGVCGL